MNGYYYKVVPKEGHENRKEACHGCQVAEYPACALEIPCCRCGEELCNSRPIIEKFKPLCGIKEGGEE